MFSTGMFNGLKKIVGKSADDTPYQPCNINHSEPSTHSVQLNMPNKFTKKRKVPERVDAPTMKKKYDIAYILTIILCASPILLPTYFNTYFIK